MPPKKGTVGGVTMVDPVNPSTPVVARQNQQPVRSLGGVTLVPQAGSLGNIVEVDPDVWTEYKRLSEDPFLGDPKMSHLDQLQSTWDFTKNVTAGFGLNVAAGFMDAIGGWDMGDTIGMAAGINQEYGNWFHDAAKGISDYVSKNFQVHEAEPGSFNPGDPGWWGKQGQSLGFSLGFVGEALAEQALFAMATGGAASEASIMSKFNAFKNLTRSGAKAAGKQAFWGAFKGIQEATVNGYQTYDQTKEKFLKLNYTPEEAERLAAVAASQAFRAEVGPTIALNALQYSTLAHNPVTGRTYSAFLEGIENKAVKNITAQSIELIGETVEETYQTMAGMEGLYQADLEAGLTPALGVGERMAKFISDSETWNSAVGGFLGGGMFSAGKGALNQFEAALGMNATQKSWDDYKKGMEGRTLNLVNQIKKAEKEGRFADAVNLKKEMSVLGALNSYHIDHLKGDMSFGTYNAHEATLEGILDAANTGDMDILSKYGLKQEDVQYVKDTFPEMISDAKEARDIYEKLKNVNDAAVLVPMSYTLHHISKLEKAQIQNKADIAQALQNMPGTAGLSADGRAAVLKAYELEALTNEEKRLQSEMARMSESAVYKDVFQARLDEVREQKAQTIKEQDELDERLRSNPDRKQRLQDLTILGNENFQHQYDLNKLVAESVFNESVEAQRRAELAELSDKKFQAKLRAERLNANIKKAKTKEEVDDALKEDKKKDPSKPWWRRRKNEIDANKKKDDLDSEKASQEAAAEAMAAATGNGPVAPASGGTAANPVPSSTANTTPTPKAPPPGPGTGPAAGATTASAAAAAAAPTVDPDAAAAPAQTFSTTRRGGTPATGTTTANGTPPTGAPTGDPDAQAAPSGPATAPGVNTTPTNPAPTASGVSPTSAPKRVTPAMKQVLRFAEYTEDQISAMTAEEAVANIQAFTARKEAEAAKIDPDERVGTPPDSGNYDPDAAYAAANAKQHAAMTNISPSGNATVVANPSATEEADVGTLFFPDYDYKDEAAQEQREQELADVVKNCVENLASELDKEPSQVTFRELMKDAIHHLGKEVAQQYFQNYRTGWEKNGYAATDFEQVFRVLFGNRADLHNAMVAIGPMAEGTTEEEHIETETEEQEKTNTGPDPIQYVPNPDGSHSAIKTNFRTSEPTPKMHFVNLQFTEHRTTDAEGKVVITRQDVPQLYQSKDFDSTFTMNPNNCAVGSRSDAEIPDNPGGIMVTAWSPDFLTKRLIPFDDWLSEMALQGYDVSVGSRLWLSKVPVIIYDDATGVPISMLPDTDWYNPTNIGLEGNATAQAALINQARTELMALRAHIHENGVGKMTVIKRTNGSLSTLPKGQLMKVSEADPKAVIGYRKGGTEFATSHGPINEDQIIKYTAADRAGETQTSSAGEVYDFRQVGMVTVKRDGQDVTVPQYMLCRAYRPETLDADAYHSVKWALRVYFAQADKTGAVMDEKTRNAIHKAIQDATGLDIYKPNHLEEYLKMFIAINAAAGPVYRKDQQGINRKHTGDTLASVYYAVTSNGSYHDGTMFLAIEKGTVGLGFKGQPMTTDPQNPMLLLHPERITNSRVTPESYAQDVNNFLDELDSLGPDPARPRKPLSGLRLNTSARVSRQAGNQANVIAITQEGVPWDAGLYSDFLRQRYQTWNRAFNLGNGVHASFAQPAIFMSYEGQEAAIEKEKAIQAAYAEGRGTPYQEGLVVKAAQTSGSGVSVTPEGVQVTQPQPVPVTPAVAAVNASEAQKSALPVTPGTTTLTPAQVAAANAAAAFTASTSAPEGVPPSATNPPDGGSNFDSALQKNRDILESLGDIEFDESEFYPAYEKVSDKLVKSVRTQLTQIEGMNATEIYNVVNNLGRNIEALLDQKYNGTVTMSSINKAVAELVRTQVEDKIPALEEMVAAIDADIAAGNNANANKRRGYVKLLEQYRKIAANKDKLKDMAINDVLAAMDMKKVKLTVRDFAQDLIFYIEDKELDISPEDMKILEDASDGKEEAYKEAVRIYNEYYQKDQESLPGEDEEADEKDEADRAEARLEDMGLSTEEIAGDDGTQRAHDFSKSAIQENNKTSVSHKFRRFTSQLPEYRPDGKPARGYGNMIKYPGFGEYYDRIMMFLVDPTDCPAEYEAMIGRLQENAKHHIWLQEFLKRMETADEEVKNSFVYGLNQHGSNFKMLMMTRDTEGNHSMKVFDTNSQQITRMLEDQWFENFNIRGLVTDDGKYLDVKKATALVNQAATWRNKLPSAKEAQAWLAEFGIDMSDESMNYMVANGYKVSQETSYSYIKWKDLFSTNNRGNSVFILLEQSLRNTLNAVATKEAMGLDPKDTLELESNPDANPLNNITKVIKSLSNIEKQYTNKVSTLSVRDGSKTVYGLTAHSQSSHEFMALKGDQSYRDKMAKSEFNAGSYLLSLLSASAEFRQSYRLEEIGINSIKEYGRKNYRDTEITKISEADQEALRIGFMQDLKQGMVRESSVNVYGRSYNLKMRIGRMMFPTMSDKNRMKCTTGPIVDMVMGDELKLNAQGNLELSDHMLAFAFSQLIEPELRRIIKHHKAAKKKGVHPNDLTNIQDYNKGAQIFIGMPGMNYVTFKGVPLPKFIADHIAGNNKLEEGDIGKIIEEIKDQSNDLLQEYFAGEVAAKIGNGGTWSSFMKKDKRTGKLTKITHMDKDYLANLKQPDVNLRLQHAAYEYVYNSHISMANNMMLYGMDLAYFSKDKIFKGDKLRKDGGIEEEGDFHSDEHGNILVYHPKNLKDKKLYASLIFNGRNGLDANLGKRLAMLMTPGKSLAGSKGEKYVQLCLRDREAVSESIDYLIELYYGKGAGKETALTDEVKGLIADLKSLDGKKVDNARKTLKKQFRDLAGYFEIESTDAQEYVTVKEAVDTLFRQGRLSRKDYETILAKAAAGQNLTIEEIEKVKQIVLQPTKPVATGITFESLPDEADGGLLAKPVYVKCSAIPLIPGTLNNMELDKLRQKMEDLEKKGGLNVRVTYGSAIKVGNVLPQHQLEIWDNDGNFIDDAINVDELVSQIKGDIPDKTSVMLMDRNNFRIQQDVPYKSDKKKEDTLSMVTQAIKILFGDGVIDIEERIFNIDGESMNGRELYKHFVDNFGIMVQNEKTNLYNELKIDEATGRPINARVTARRLENILRREGIERGYPPEALEGLKVQKDTGDFTLPIWLAPDHDKYENLLGAIITNRLVRYRFPGCQLVAASEEGFKTRKENLTEAQIQKEYPGTVFTPGWKGSIQPARYDSEGNLMSAQCLLPAKFRDKKGKLINLIEDGYAKFDEATGKWTLDMDKFDPELLSVSSFRIPVSGHGSMSQLEIVGFLPPTMGDLIIVPKDMTKQKGMDYDVDKENLYMLWHTLGEDGKISKSTKDNMPESKKTITKLAQNEIVKVHQTILGNKDPRIQQKIGKVLGLDFERKQAQLFMEYMQETGYNKSIYSDQHQKDKMALGAAGQSGIGVYANMMTMHAMIQQAVKPNGEKLPMYLKDGTLEEPLLPFVFTLGGHTSKGVLGRTDTFDGTRSLADVIAGRLNIATDNEKEQIMGMIGINSETISVDTLLVMLGYDQAKVKDVTGEMKNVSLSSLLLMQPIVRNYVAGVKEKKGLTAEFSANAKQQIYKKMLTLYPVKQKENKLLDGLSPQRAYMENLTAQKMFDNLNGTVSDNLVQQSALHLYLKLEKYAKSMAKIQSQISIQREGVGKSVPEMMKKYNDMSALAYDDKLHNIHGLVGEFDFTDYEKMDNMEMRQDKIDAGYIPMRTRAGQKYLLKPTTTTGHMMTAALKSAYELWSDYFPYDHPAIRETVERIMAQISGPDDFPETLMAKELDIYEELRKYLYSSHITGLYGAIPGHGIETADPQQDRYRLFIDNTNPLNPNMSLATYLNKVTSMKGATLPGGMHVLDRIRSNPLISQFTYKQNKNFSLRTGWRRGGPSATDMNLMTPLKPSFLNYNNAKGADMGDARKYRALVELMDNPELIVDANGEPILMNGQKYTTRMLATDIIAATYLKGGAQRATEITKFIPIPFLKEIGFAGGARYWQSTIVDAKYGQGKKGTIKVPGTNDMRQDFWSYILGDELQIQGMVTNPGANRFERQFFQHNPSLLNDEVPEEIPVDYATQQITVVPPAEDAHYTPPTFMFRKLGKNSYALFERREESFMYDRIPTLGMGDTGLSSEYSMKSDYVTSIINLNPERAIYNEPPAPAPPVGSENGTPTVIQTLNKAMLFNLQSGNLRTILGEIQTAANPGLATLARELMPLIANDVTISIADIRGRSTYTEATRSIVVSQSYLMEPHATVDEVAALILHEYIHSITVKELDNYFVKGSGELLPGISEGDLPAHILKLHRVFKKIVESLAPGELDEFARQFELEKSIANEDRALLVYGGYNIREILSLLSHPNFRARLSEIKDEQGVTLIQRLADAFHRIMQALGITSGNLTSSAFEALLEISDVQREKLGIPVPLSEDAIQANLRRIMALAEARNGPSTASENGPSGAPFDVGADLGAAAAEVSQAAADRAANGDPDAASAGGDTVANLFPQINSEMYAALAELEQCL